MPFDPGPGEPHFTDARPVSWADWIDALLRFTGAPPGRPRLIAIDGRGGAGKTTVAALIRAAVPRCDVVHSDDLAWNHSVFDWEDLLVDGILEPLYEGHRVDYRPPAWAAHDRDGRIVVPAGLATVIVEGTGVIRASTTDWFDATIWVQADFAQAKARAIDRDVAAGTNGDRAGALAFWDEWQAEEEPFLIDQQPWQRADSVIVGTLGPDEPPDGGAGDLILVARQFRRPDDDPRVANR